MRFRIAPESIYSVAKEFYAYSTIISQVCKFLTKNLLFVILRIKVKRRACLFCCTNKNKNDFWLKNNTNEGQSDLASVNGKSTASNKDSSVKLRSEFLLSKNLIRNIFKRAHNAKIYANAKQAKCTNKRKLSTFWQQRALFDFSIASWHLRKERCLNFPCCLPAKSQGTHGKKCLSLQGHVCA